MAEATSETLGRLDGEPATAPAGPALIGARVTRREDRRYTSGRGRYLDDLTAPDMLHLRLIRSHHAHARITHIRIGESEAPPEGTAFFTGTDTGELGIRADVNVESWQNSVQPVLAVDRVRFVGEPVAAVLHADPYVVEDAAELVDVGYEPLPPVIDLAAALDRRSPVLHDGWESNLFVRRHRSFGDVDAARKTATHVIRRVTRTNRQAGVPLEGRGVLAVPDAHGAGLTLWSSTQIPHLVRTLLAQELDLPEHQIRVIAPDVGGGFGVKGHVFTEELLAAWLALRLGSPVKWVEDRIEHLQASIHARDHLHLVEAFVNASGQVLGLRAQFVVDAGAYSIYPWTAGSDPGMAAKVILGPYDIQDYEVEDIAVATNKCPMGTYRGVARPSAVFTMERLMDEIARELELDPAEVRRENLVKEFPYRTAMGLLYDPGSYQESLDKAVESVDYDQLRKQQSNADGRRHRVGVGLALYNEQSAHGTPDFEIRKTPIETGYVSALVRMQADGAVTVHTGLQSHGQGMETTLAQVAADELHVPLESVRVVHGDTGTSPYTVGTWGSRGAALGAGAIAGCARAIRTKLLAIAAELLAVAPEELVFGDGSVQVRGDRSVAVPITELAYMANRHTAMLPTGMTPGLEATFFMDGPPRGTFSNSCHAAVVEVDTHTGKVRILRYVVVEDCGAMINPTVVEGQVHGGVAQGIGSALLEESMYSDEGQPLSSTFIDYLMPTATDVPGIEVLHLSTPSPWTEHGIKGMGESGAIGPMAAVANAVSDAIGRPVFETPLRPHRVRQAVSEETDTRRIWDKWASHPTLLGFWRDPDSSDVDNTWEDVPR